MSEGLDERKTKILHAIIQTYLETGEPVGLAPERSQKRLI